MVELYKAEDVKVTAFERKHIRTLTGWVAVV